MASHIDDRLLELRYQEHTLVPGTWQLWRVCDGRGEAGGFATRAEAEAWCDEQGYRIQPHR